MPRYPHTRLFSGPRRFVVLSGPHIQVLDTQTGLILYSTANLAQQDRDAVVKSGPIRCSGLSREGRYLAAVGDDKRLKIWDLESLTLLSTRELPKKPTSIEFTKNTDILVSDKFGDVFRYALHLSTELVGEKIAGDKEMHAVVRALRQTGSHENPSGGELVLGHASLLTSFLLTLDEQFIITADRDEHIRVSWYPDGYTIESYCLGHRKYVSAIHIPVVSPARLVSGGGDLDLKVWDWTTGRLQRNISVFATVEPFIKVKVQKRGYDWQDDGHEGEEAVKGRGRIKNRGKGMRRNDASPGCSTQTSNATTSVFVVHKISSFASGEENHVVFSAVGGTAIFEFILAETDDQPDIRHYDFEEPVVDFTVYGEGTIWVLLDADYLEECDVSSERGRKLVQAVQWSADQFVDAGSSALLDSLNTICSLPATPEDLKALDLYSNLSSLPKVVDAEAESQALEPVESMHGYQYLEDEPTGEDPSASVGMTKRALGRLKHKRALERLHSEQVDTSGLGTKKVKADTEGNVHPTLNE